MTLGEQAAAATVGNILLCEQILEESEALRAEDPSKAALVDMVQDKARGFLKSSLANLLAIVIYDSAVINAPLEFEGAVYRVVLDDDGSLGIDRLTEADREPTEPEFLSSQK